MIKDSSGVDRASKATPSMRIVHVITRLIRAGADENTILTCIKQAEAGHEVILIHGREYDPHYYQLSNRNFRLIRVGNLVRETSFLNDTSALIRLFAQIRRLKPAVVHTHTSKAGILGRLAARAAGVPAIIHGVHIVPFVNVRPFSRALYLFLERAAASVTHAFIDVSHGMRTLCVEASIGQPSQHHIVHSGFDLSAYRNAPWPEDWREILGAPDAADPKPPTVVMLAALTARKRHVELLDEIAHVVAGIPTLRLLLCGEGETRPLIEKRIHDLGLAKNVKLLGFRADPERIVALADLCILSSVREGLPRVVMQYLAGGKPCVVADLPGIEEVVAHGVNGLIQPSERLDLFAEAVADLLQDPARLAHLSKGAAETTLDSWDAEKMWPRMELVYQSVFRGLTSTRGAARRPTWYTVSR
jgi:glycosyltransferase involved in cell wall biosynthesis